MVAEALAQPNTTLNTGNETLATWQVGRLSPMPSHIPDRWDLVRLTSVARLESGHTPSRRHPEYWDGDIPWIYLHDSTALDVPEIHSTAQTIGILGLENSSARLLPKGTVVFSRTATVGKATVMGREMATSQDFANYVCGSRLYNQYLVHLFRFMAPEWKRLMAGSTLNTIYMPVFEELQILLPPKSEQEAIAEALSDADALIEALQQLIVKQRAVKQGAMQELLTGKRRLPGFETIVGYKQTELGVIPEDWDVISVGSFCDIAAGRDLVKSDFSPTSDQKFQFPIYSNALAHSGLYGYSKSFQYETDKITITARGDIGHAVYRDTRFCAIGRLLVLSAKRSCDLRFVTEYINTCVEFALESTGVPQLTAPQISKYLVALPLSKTEQTAIAAVLSDMDAEIAALEAKLDKARQVKQGMMQELLTGKTRLV